MAMSTLKSSGYRTWSTRAFPIPDKPNNDLFYALHDRSHGTTRSRGTAKSLSTKRSQSTHLRLHLVTNSQGLVQLDLSNTDLQIMPIEIFLFSRLEVLKLSQNYFREIPLAISRLRSLKFLYLEENSLSFLPETLSNCINLLEINLTKNKLAALPTNIGMLKNLRVLRLGQNEFECLPHEIGQLENLRYLDVQGNSLWYLPFSIAKMHKLKYLNLSNNKFEHLPLPVCKITSLKTLTLRGNNLMNLLPDFDCLQQLQELNLAHNNFEIIPQSIFRLKSLSYLNLNGNMLETVPNALTTLKTLKVLHLHDNNIHFIPDTFPNLQYLNIANNKLYNFSVVNMKHLKLLNANNNYLENIPMGLYSLTKIQSVRLNTNQIRYISTDIANLKKLRTLDIGNNMLVNIPQVMQQLDRLDYFNVKGNKIKDRIALHNGEIAAPIDYYKKRRMFEAKRQTMDSGRRYKTRKSQRSRSGNYENRTESRASTLPTTQNNSHKMWDSADLLQNGFTERHLETNLSSAYLNRKLPASSDQSRGNHDNSFTENSFRSSGHITAHEAALMTDSDDVSTSVPATDYKLLGVCNQVEMLLNKQLLHPVLSLKGHDMGKSFSEKAIVKTASGLWRMSEERNENAPPGLVVMTTETFTVTPQGGWLTSSHDNNISIFLPPKAVSTLIQTQMKILKIKAEKLLQLRQSNRMVSNIIAIGPIVYLKNLDSGDFNHQVTITIPSPKSETRGHLHLLTIKDDNSCVPCTSGFQHKNGYVVLRAWNLAGKAAVITRAKCKYKACKSMENLLNELTATS
ncbi:uncharacterized protein LOC123540341 [Mercenaria mercenaria]|uniref:uncharacterized protein LOC123540341 n=1 Tax=Mercenaria mercenaria TaxID=6596 RepID=UPI00234F468A|nr:uncharacterized protein LOC123540341 [Mercenaria mercenaria]